ncbi:MAG TPA: transcriptional regulator FtrA [Candidatus Dormibacteraeota bacterium]|nr:transcriptional regulator FtrA [Candidatus Dormibacteraeota bacterium]
MASRNPRSVVTLAYDGLCIFEFGIAVEIFGLPRPELNVDWYRFQVCSLERGPIRATGGITVKTARGLGLLQRAGTIIIPGWRDVDEPPPKPLVRAMQRAYANGARLVSICSGVFVLAAAGLLDGKRVTTHWRYADRLTSRFPGIEVDSNVLYIDQGNILTSAGSAAGIDLCLHIVRRDYGAEIANAVARRLVMSPHRDGGQAQYVPDPIRQETSGGLAPILQWAQSRLHNALLVDDLARKAAMSPRTFARRFRQEAGTTPHQWLLRQRLLAAQRLLERTNDSVERIAEVVGFQTSATLRLHFQRILETTPSAYRRRFSTPVS